MLQSIKGSLSSPWLRYSIFGVIILSFGVWGIGDILRRVVSPGADVLVEGRGVSIDQQLFAVTWQRATAPFRVQGLTNEQLLAGALPRLLLERLVSRALLQKESKRLALTVPPSVLRDVLAGNPLFAGDDGKFASWQFASFLRESGLSEEAYLEELSNNLVETSLLGNLAFSVSLPQSFVRYLLAAKLEQRSLEILRVPTAGATSIADPGDRKLQDFMRAEEALFRQAEYRKFSLLVIEPTVAESLADATLRAEYEARRESLKSPELRSYSQLFFTEESLARRVMGKVMEDSVGSSNLQQAARAIDANAPAPISLAKQRRDDILDAAVAEGVFSLSSVGAVKLVEGGLGWYVLRLDALVASSLASFEELRNALNATLALEQASAQYEKDIEQAEDMILTGATLAEIAASVGGKTEETLLIDAQGRIKQGRIKQGRIKQGINNETGVFESSLKRLSLEESDEAALLELGFSLSSVGEVASGLEILGEDYSAPSTLSKNNPRIILLSLQELQEPRLAALEPSNRAQVLSIYRALNAEKQASTRANDIAASARQSSLSAVARLEGVALRRAVVARDAKDWQAGFLAAIFIARVGDVLTTFGDNHNEHLVVRLSGVTRPALRELSSRELEAFTSELAEEQGLPLAVYQQVLESRANLEINEGTFESFITNSTQGVGSQGSAPR